MKVQRAIVVTLTSAWALVSHFKIYVKFFHVMGKALSGKLYGDKSCFVRDPRLNLK